MGFKHAQEVSEKEAYGNWALQTAHKAQTEGGVPKEQLDAAFKLMRGIFGDTATDIIQDSTKKTIKRQEQERADALETQRRNALLAQSRENRGPTAMPQAALNSPFLQSPQAPAPAAPPQTMPQTAPAQPPGAPALPPGATPAALAMPQGPYQNPAYVQNIMQRSMPKPPSPFSGGAVQGTNPAPMPQDPVQGRISGAASVGAGFGGPVTTPFAMPQGEINPLRDFNQVGTNLAAMAAPGERFKTDESIRQAGAVAQQSIQIRRAMIENDPQLKKEYDLMTPRQKMTFLTGGSITAEPHFNVGGLTMSDPQDVDIRGNPVPPNTLGTRTIMNGQPVFTAREVRKVLKSYTKPDGTTGVRMVNPYTEEVGAEIPGLEGAAKLVFQKITTPDGRQLIAGVNPTTGKLGAPIDPQLVGVDPRMLQTMTTTDRIHVQQQADGTYQAIPFIDTSTSQKVAPPGVAAPAVTPATPGVTPMTPVRRTPVAGAGGGKLSTQQRIGEGVTVGARALTPGQRITFAQKQAAFDNTIDLVNSVKSKMNLLNSLIDAKRIEFQIDPQQGIIKSFFNRALLNDEEAKLAGDFASLTEHINTLRGPLGATGFRGHEAWGALQQQRGQLTANPQVTSRVLDNTLKALTGQRNAIADVLTGKSKQVPSWASSLPNVGFKVEGYGKDDGEYHIPPDQVDKFMEKYPNAKPLKE
jgi:hypothetical protein